LNPPLGWGGHVAPDLLGCLVTFPFFALGLFLVLLSLEPKHVWGYRLRCLL
jgi:hypothetical protein